MTRPASPSVVRRRPVLWWGLSAVALVVGFADLWRGGVSVGPACLVLGYGVLIPLAILRG